jgi:hypothetical protein
MFWYFLSNLTRKASCLNNFKVKTSLDNEKSQKKLSINSCIGSQLAIYIIKFTEKIEYLHLQMT